MEPLPHAAIRRARAAALLTVLLLFAAGCGLAGASPQADPAPRAAPVAPAHSPAPAAPPQEAAAPVVAPPPAPPAAAQDPHGVPLARRLEAHLQFLASADLGGRETGTVHSLVTGQYVASAFRSAGLLPAGEAGDFLQRYPLSRNRLVLDQTTLALQAEDAVPPAELRLFDDFLLRGFGSLGFDLAAELVFAGHGIVSEERGVDEYAGLDVAGRFVVVFEGRPHGRGELRTDSHWRAKRAAAQARGAAGLVVLYDLDEPLHRESLDNAADELRYPVLAIPAEEGEAPWPIVMLKTGAAGALLAAAGLDLQAEREARRDELVPGRALPGLRLTLRAPVVAEATHAYNVAGLVPGADPLLRGEYLVVSAHNDHIGILRDGRINFGADDNASGTATLLAAAEVLAAGPAPRRSVLFLSVSGEEKGLLGSDWWCQHPTLPLAGCIGNVNIDMVGRNDPDAVGATPSPEMPEHNTLVSRAVELGPAAGLTITWTAPAASDDRVDNYFHRSDHYNFAQQGIPVVFFFSGLHEDYHRPTDTLDQLDRGKLQRMVRLVCLLAADVADADARPARIQPGAGVESSAGIKSAAGVKSDGS